MVAGCPLASTTLVLSRTSRTHTRSCFHAPTSRALSHALVLSCTHITRSLSRARALTHSHSFVLPCTRPRSCSHALTRARALTRPCSELMLTHIFSSLACFLLCSDGRDRHADGVPTNKASTTLAPTAHHSVTGTDAPTARPSLHLRECLVTACGGDDSSAFGRAARVVLALPPTATAATPPQQAVWSVQVRHCSSPPVRSSNISFCLASSTQAGDETLSPTPPFEIYTEQLRLQFALCSSSCRHGTTN